LQKNKKIAVISVNASAYSETFIKAQVDLLPAALVLHSGWLPTKKNDKDIIHKYKKYINDIVKPVFKSDLFSLKSAIVKILKKEKIEAVLAQYGPGGCAMIEVCKTAKIPLFVHFLGFDASHEPTLNAYSALYQELFREAEGIIAVSKKMAGKIVELGCPTHKIVVTPCGPNDNFFKLNPTFTNNVFFGYGRFVDKKAPYLTVLAFKEVLKKHADAKLILGGEGELLHTCKSIAKAYGIENNVTFPGILKPEEAMKLMETSLAFVQHSIVADSGDSEGTPVAVVEASTAALPVIATWHAGIPDVIINNETGFLVNECDISAMATAMLQLIENKGLAKSMGLAGRKRIKNNFSMDHYISTLRNLINGTNREL
jgi:colanic acid/amylovoran biosynthesis glycosyltransferase